MSRPARLASVALQAGNAKIADAFGLEWATKLFGQEAIDSLPKFERGPNKGKPKGYIHTRELEQEAAVVAGEPTREQVEVQQARLKLRAAG